MKILIILLLLLGCNSPNQGQRKYNCSEIQKTTGYCHPNAKYESSICFVYNMGYGLIDFIKIKDVRESGYLIEEIIVTYETERATGRLLQWNGERPWVYGKGELSHEYFENKVEKLSLKKALCLTDVL